MRVDGGSNGCLCLHVMYVLLMQITWTRNLNVLFVKSHFKEIVSTETATLGKHKFNLLLQLTYKKKTL